MGSILGDLISYHLLIIIGATSRWLSLLHRSICWFRVSISISNSYISTGIYFFTSWLFDCWNTLDDVPYISGGAPGPTKKTQLPSTRIKIKNSYDVQPSRQLSKYIPCKSSHWGYRRSTLFSAYNLFPLRFALTGGSWGQLSKQYTVPTVNQLNAAPNFTPLPHETPRFRFQSEL